MKEAAESASEGGELFKQFRSIGLEPAELAAMKTMEQISAITKAISELDDEGQRLFKVDEIFAGATEEYVTAFSDGGRAIKEGVEEAIKLGSETKASADNIKEMALAIAKVELAAENMQRAFFKVASTKEGIKAIENTAKAIADTTKLIVDHGDKIAFTVNRIIDPLTEMIESVRKTLDLIDRLGTTPAERATAIRATEVTGNLFTQAPSLGPGGASGQLLGNLIKQLVQLTGEHVGIARDQLREDQQRETVDLSIAELN